MKKFLMFTSIVLLIAGIISLGASGYCWYRITYTASANQNVIQSTFRIFLYFGISLELLGILFLILRWKYR